MFRSAAGSPRPAHAARCTPFVARYLTLKAVYAPTRLSREAGCPSISAAQITPASSMSLIGSTRRLSPDGCCLSSRPCFGLHPYRYATFCALAGVDPDDQQDGVPNIDSVNVWPSLVDSTQPSARTEIPLGFCTPNTDCDENRSPGGMNDAALISGRYKIVTGRSARWGWNVWRGSRRRLTASHGRVSGWLGLLDRTAVSQWQ